MDMRLSTGSRSQAVATRMEDTPSTISLLQRSLRVSLSICCTDTGTSSALRAGRRSPPWTMSHTAATL